MSSTTVRYSAEEIARNLRLKPPGQPLRIVVGAGPTAFAGWISTDLPAFNLLDRHSWRTFFSEPAIFGILAEHVFEHFSVDQSLLALSNCRQFLIPGGYIRLAVPDGWNTDPDYIEQVRPGGYGPAAHDHKTLWNLDSLTDVARRAGFLVRPLEYFDSCGRLRYRNWDPDDGLIRRSIRFDHRNKGEQIRFTSLILDCYRPL